MKKGVFISEIVPGVGVEGLFCVSSKQMLETRNGDPYLAITLVDRTGEIEARVWNGARKLDPVFAQSDYVWIKAEAHKFRDAIQLKIAHLKAVRDKDLDPGLFLPVVQADTEELWSEFSGYIKEIRSPVLKPLLEEIFRDQEISKAFRLAPAGKRMHHAYIGGLLEHTVSVTRLANSVCSLYLRLDRDLLVSGAMVHDIGKIDEFSYSRPPIDYTDIGRLVGHVVLGTSIIDKFIAKLDINASSPQIIALKHMVLSHHGQREFGAPVLPMIEEAVVLNMIDDLDAKLNYLGRLKKDIHGTGYGWTEYQRLFERFFYLHGLEEMKQGHVKQREEGEAKAKRGPDLQPTLWSEKG
ncbi:MAG: HD domain-containing protein [Nitrospiraceae bacterium]|nr:HD domain-containing protein [Nitrospiraceae bacterium]